MQGVLNSIARTNKALTNTQDQIATGLQNPNPATNPYASTLSKSIEGDVAIAKRVQSITQQANNTLQVAFTVLNANADLLNEMRVQALDSINGTNTSADRNSLNASFQEKLTNITSNALSKWGQRTLLDGTFSMNYQTSTVTKEANVSGSSITDNLLANDLTINGQDIGAVTGTAKDMAAAINSFSNTTQVIASAFTSATGAGAFNSLAVSNPIILINDIPVYLGEFSGTESSNQIVDQAVAAINSFTGLAGQNIMAKNVGGFLQVNATDGSDLKINYTNITSENVLGPLPTDYVGSLTLSSVFSIEVGGNAPGKAGLTSGVTEASGVRAILLSDMRADAIFGSSLPDISTVSNAQTALAAIDSALDKVLNEISKISTSSASLENVGENMSDIAFGLQDDLATVRDLDYPEAITKSANLEALKEAGLAVLNTELNSFRKLGNLVAESLRGS